MKKLPLTIKAAWISAVAMIVSAIITGVLLFPGYDEPSLAEDVFSSFLMDVAPGSKVTIIVTSQRDDEARILEAKFEKIVREKTKIQLIESDSINNELRSFEPQNLNLSTVSDLDELVDYVIFVDIENFKLKVFNVGSGEVVYSKAIGQ